MEGRSHPHTEPLEPLQSVAAACAILDASRSAIYGFMAAGQLAYVKLGKRRLIEPAELRRFVAARRVPLQNDADPQQGSSGSVITSSPGVGSAERVGP